MRRKYEITITTTLALPGGEWRGGEEGDGKRRRNMTLLEKMEGEKEGWEDNRG